MQIEELMQLKDTEEALSAVKRIQPQSQSGKTPLRTWAGTFGARNSGVDGLEAALLLVALQTPRGFALARERGTDGVHEALWRLRQGWMSVPEDEAGGGDLSLSETMGLVTVEEVSEADVGEGDDVEANDPDVREAIGETVERMRRVRGNGR